MQCFVCNVSLLSSALHAKCPLLSSALYAKCPFVFSVLYAECLFSFHVVLYIQMSGLVRLTLAPVLHDPNRVACRVRRAEPLNPRSPEPSIRITEQDKPYFPFPPCSVVLN